MTATAIISVATDVYRLYWSESIGIVLPKMVNKPLRVNMLSTSNVFQ